MSEERKSRSQCFKNYEILESSLLNRDKKLNESSEQLNLFNDRMEKQAENMSNIITSIIQNELKKHVLIGFGIAVAVAASYKLFISDWRKRKYQEFHR